tara:strand:+ start:243 stop:416 length:174 start_codon:yes stop_codon:yes gene_type:complete
MRIEDKYYENDYIEVKLNFNEIALFMRSNDLSTSLIDLDKEKAIELRDELTRLINEI